VVRINPVRRIGVVLRLSCKNNRPKRLAIIFICRVCNVKSLEKRQEQRLEAAQIKFLRHFLGITKLDKEKNQRIRERTGAQNIIKEIKQYQEKWLQHVQRMDTNRIPKQTLQYKPKG